MIKSDRELEIVREQIAFLQKARDSSRNDPDSTEFFRELGARGFQRKMNLLQDEVTEYENSRAQRSAAGQVVS